MSIKLNITLIDVGAGDSIFFELIDQGISYYGLIDSNDSANEKSSFIFFKRFLEMKGVKIDGTNHFEFVLLSHSHADHGKGLKFFIKKFGTKELVFGESIQHSTLVSLLHRPNTNNKIGIFREVYKGESFPFGSLQFKVLWPPEGRYDRNNENNNSLVLELLFDGKRLIFTGDAEHPVWDSIATEIKDDTVFFKVPHHGASNGCFDDKGMATWIDRVPNAILGISTHFFPHQHPNDNTITLFNRRSSKYYRTDIHHHITLHLEEGSKKIIVKAKGFQRNVPGIINFINNFKHKLIGSWKK